MSLTFKDSKPQVGIFEIVDGVFLMDSEDVQFSSSSGEYFDGLTPHLHSQDIKRLVINSPFISEETKNIFRTDSNAYLNYPRGRVDYNTVERKYHVMAARKFFTNETVEKVTRMFHLPPVSTNNTILEIDNGHYGY